MHPLARLDHAHVWHPFTQMRDWLGSEPIVIVEGRGAVLRDVRGREYLDANASIWTNLHGHGQPQLNRAIRRQLGKVAHVSALGLANEPASRLAARLVAAAAPREEARIADATAGSLGGSGAKPTRGRMRESSPGVGVDAGGSLRWVFYSDDGSTALEVALKQAYAYARRAGGLRRPRFLALEGAYHGDTVGAVSLGHIDLFHRTYAGLLFKSDAVMAPYCYRCPFNRARPERADARAYRKCDWECLGKLERCLERQGRRGEPYAGFVVEPVMQGAAGMIPQPAGWLREAAKLARAHGALVIADEVMTAFGRMGEGGEAAPSGDGRAVLFASQREGVRPDFLCVAKGLTGGYLPMAATLTTEAVFGAFLGEYDEFKTFFHGHSYTANPLGAAAALASLDLLESEASRRKRQRLERALAGAVESLWTLPQVGDVRREGLVVGVELVRNWRTREPFDLRERVGIRVCAAMAARGVLTRPIGNVIVLMPPYAASPDQVRRMVEVLHASIRTVG